MAQDPLKIVNLLHEQLPPETIQQSIICWYKKIFEKGESFHAGSTVITVPFRSTLVFVDLKPKANWGHPCQYFFISDDADREPYTVAAMFPPFMDTPPHDYVVLLRYGIKPADDRNFNPY